MYGNESVLPKKREEKEICFLLTQSQRDAMKSGPSSYTRHYGLTDALGCIEPNFGPNRAGDIKHSNVNIGKAKKNCVMIWTGTLNNVLRRQLSGIRKICKLTYM